MKKLILFTIAFFAVSRIKAIDTFENWQSTIVPVNNINSVLVGSDTFKIGYIQVFSTAVDLGRLNIYDTKMTTTTAVKKYEGIPLCSNGEFYGGIQLSTGMAVTVIGNADTKVRLLYKREKK